MVASVKNGYKMALVKLDPSFRYDLRAIVHDEEVMKWIANGKIWSDDKLDRFLRYCEEDEKSDNDNRKNYFWGIMVRNRLTLHYKLLGVVGIHFWKQMSLTIYLARHVQGNGIGFAACEMVMRKYQKLKSGPVAIDTRLNNFAMIRIAEKLGAKKLKTVRIGFKQYMRYIWNGDQQVDAPTVDKICEEMKKMYDEPEDSGVTLYDLT